MAKQVGQTSFEAGTTTPAIPDATKAALFYVDVFGGSALFRGDGKDPTARDGLPFQPGGHIVLVGDQNISNARWRNVSPVAPARIHVLYYDQVDVVAADLIGRDPPQKGDANLILILEELRTLNTLMAQMGVRELQLA